MSLAQFRQSLAAADVAQNMAAGLIGEGMMIPGLIGDVPLVYADYVASGRALRQVEDFITSEVLPYYANSHTEASFCGARITQLRAEARAEIARLVNAGPQHEVIFAGSGATAGLNRLVHLLGVQVAQKPVVFIGPYEHHSNILPWRESRATVVEIPEAAQGGPDLVVLDQALRDHADADLKIGSFSAASNVTGVITDPVPVIATLKAHGALSVWDYAGGGPYLPVDMAQGMDAAVLSPHKFPGGPGASGVFVVNTSVVRCTCPSWPGGGTVSFVSPWRHDYADDLASREEAGTPNVIGDIRAALVFLVKDAVGQAEIDTREAQFGAMAAQAWADNPQITVLGADKAHRLPIFSLLIRDGAGNMVSPQLFTRLLSDIYGIQARGGCACAGPYGHRLLGIGRDESENIHDALISGQMVEKPGWTRLNFSYLMTDATVQFILDSVTDLVRDLDRWAPLYAFDPVSGQYQPRENAA